MKRLLIPGQMTRCAEPGDRCGRMLLMKDSPAAEQAEGNRSEGKIQVTPWALQRYRMLWRKANRKLVFGSTCRGRT